MKIGLLKSKIEEKLNESYINGSFKTQIKKFKNLILEDENLSAIYHIYDELSTPKGFTKEFAEQYINEAINLYNKLQTNINYSKVSRWVNDVRSKNIYSDIDNLFSKNNYIIESKLISRNNIIDTLMSSPKNRGKVYGDPNRVVEVANKTINDYLSRLNESEIKEIKSLFNLNEGQIKERYQVIQELVEDRLSETSKISDDQDLVNKITETLEKIKSDNINVITLHKLKSLYKSL